MKSTQTINARQGKVDVIKKANATFSDSVKQKQGEFNEVNKLIGPFSADLPRCLEGEF